MAFRIRLPRAIYTAMLDQARRELPNECCGALAARIGDDRAVRTIARCYPLVNQLARPTAYQAEPRGQIRAERDMRENGLETVAFYHSHPTSDPIPSATDLALNYWGDEVVFFIISLGQLELVMRGWRLHETTYTEAEWELIEE